MSDAVAKGAKVLTGGARVTPPGTPADGTGTFYAPTVLIGCHSDMDVFRTETFGPVARIIHSSHPHCIRVLLELKLRRFNDVGC